MDAGRNELRERLQALLQSWRESGVPPRWQLMNSLHDLLVWKDGRRLPGLWAPPPLMLTATLDDGWGHGLEVIETCGRAAGLRIEHLGLLQSPERIIRRCDELRPQFLGMTVLQLDSELSLSLITEGVKAHTQVVAGGPPFRIDPDLAARTGVALVAKDVADFLAFVLQLQVR